MFRPARGRRPDDDVPRRETWTPRSRTASSRRCSFRTWRSGLPRRRRREDASRGDRRAVRRGRAARRDGLRRGRRRRRAVRPRPRMSGGSGISETETVSETEEARALANAAIESSRSDDGDDDRGGTVVPGGSPGSFERVDPASARGETRDPDATNGGPGGPRRPRRRKARAVAAERTSAATVRRGTARRPRRFRRRGRPLRRTRRRRKTKTKTKRKRNQKSIGNARPTTAPPSYHPPPNLPSASVAARRSPLAVPAPRRAASLASSSAAAIGDANDARSCDRVSNLLRVSRRQRPTATLKRPPSSPRARRERADARSRRRAPPRRAPRVTRRRPPRRRRWRARPVRTWATRRRRTRIFLLVGLASRLESRAPRRRETQREAQNRRLAERDRRRGQR